MVVLWKSIREGWILFSKNIKFLVRDGIQVYFQHDVWCGDASTKDLFLDLFILLLCFSCILYWSPCFIRALQDWELECMVKLFDMLHSYLVSSRGVDQMSRD